MKTNSSDNYLCLVQWSESDHSGTFIFIFHHLSSSHTHGSLHCSPLLCLRSVWERTCQKIKKFQLVLILSSVASWEAGSGQFYSYYTDMPDIGETHWDNNIIVVWSLTHSTLELWSPVRIVYYFILIISYIIWKISMLEFVVISITMAFQFSIIYWFCDTCSLLSQFIMLLTYYELS